jgi:hypothetical protein
MSKTGTAYVDRITDDGIAVVTIDYFPVNALSEGLTNGVKSVMRQLEGRDPGIDKTITGVVVHGAGRAFCAGANISAFGSASKTPPVKLGRKTSGPFGLGLDVIFSDRECNYTTTPTQHTNRDLLLGATLGQHRHNMTENLTFPMICSGQARWSISISTLYT